MQGFTHAEEADRAYKVKEIPEDIDGDVDLRINIYWREGNVKLFFVVKMQMLEGQTVLITKIFNNNIVDSRDAKGKEAGFPYGGDKHERKCGNIQKIMDIMPELSSIVKYHFKVEFNQDSVYYYRCVAHLKFFVQRLVKGKLYEEDGYIKLATPSNSYKN